MVSVSDILGNKNVFSGGKSMPAIAHEVSLDITGATIAAVVIAGLLEQASSGSCTLEHFLSALSDHILGRKSDKVASQTDRNNVNELLKYIRTGNFDKPMRAKSRQSIINDCNSLIRRCNSLQLTGEVASDWIVIREAIKDCESEYLKNLYKDSLFIKLLHKGSQLNSSLAQIWRANGNYFGATEVVNNALTQEHFATSTKTWSGVNVMTIHKAKGKEFDEVIIYEGSFDGQRILYGTDYDRAKLNLRVAVTRAKSRAIIFTPQSNPCPLI
jgi:DNA helicase-2/ATP-dependent DNA helicase PcrA